MKLEDIERIANQKAFDTPTMGADVYAAGTSYAGRLREQKERIRRLDEIVANRATVTYPDGSVVSAELKGNAIATNLGRVAKSVGGPEPSIIVDPWAGSEEAEKAAGKLQLVLRNYSHLNRLGMMRRTLASDLIGTGMATLVVWPDYKTPDPSMRFPLFRRLDPRIVWPDPSFLGGDMPNRLITKETVKLYELTGAHGPELKSGLFTEYEGGRLSGNEDVEVVGYYDEKICIKFATRQVRGGSRRYVVLSRLENVLGKPLFVVGTRLGFDNQPRGQFDNAIPLLLMKNEIATLMMLDLGEQVFSQPIVRGRWENIESLGSPDVPLVTSDPEGQSAIERVPTAQHSNQIYSNLQFFGEEENIAAAVSAAAGGRVDQSIISAAAVNALQGTDAREREDYLMILADMFSRAFSVALEVDEKYLGTDDEGQPVSKTLTTAATGMKKAESYSPEKDINGHYNVRVEYGEMAAFDELNRQAAVIQRQQVGLVSRRKAMELTSKDDSDIFEEESQMAQEAILDGVLVALKVPPDTPGAAPMEQRLRAMELLNEGKTPYEMATILAKEAGQAAPTVMEEPPLPGLNGAAQQALSLEKGGVPGRAEGQPPAALPSLQELGVGG